MKMSTDWPFRLPRSLADMRKHAIQRAQRTWLALLYDAAVHTLGAPRLDARGRIIPFTVYASSATARYNKTQDCSFIYYHIVFRKVF